MRFLAINHPRLGASPGGIPDHLVTDRTAFSTRNAWFRAIDHAVQEQVHAVILTGEIIASSNRSLEPFGPLQDGISQLQQANIPVVAVSDGILTPATARRFDLDQAMVFLEDQLEWDPPITTSTNHIEGPSIHIVAARLAESTETPVPDPITLDDMDHPGSIWLLTSSRQPDSMEGDHALVIEAGALAPLNGHETGDHGAWLVDTNTPEATLVPLANLEYASTAIDVSPANNLDDVERMISQELIALADGSTAATLLVDATLTGATRLYPALADISSELQQSLSVEHEGISIALTRIAIDATPDIDLEPLVGRPDPVGEVARLLLALSTGNEMTEAQSALITAVDQKLLAVSHARVFGSIIDTTADADATTLLQRQAWAALDMMVRQRGID